MDRSKQYSLLLLAGGKSSRMGRDKAELSYRGETFLDQMIAKGEQLGIRQIYVSGHEYARMDVRVVWDIYPRCGPLGGIHACMREMDTPYCLVLPVDAPQLPVAVLEALLRQHEECAEKDKVLIWKHDDREEPLIAIYPVTMADHLETLISDGPTSVFHALRTWGYDCLNVAVSAEESMNINTPDAYRQLLQGSGEKVMEKETIHLRRICCGECSDVTDEVALEHHFTIALKNGGEVSVACTPSYVEELTLGRRYLLGDLSAEECGQSGEEEALGELKTDDVFAMTRAFFESPGELFQTTGCAHSCALFHQGKLVCVMEDIGRHNALDKVIGYAIRNHIPLCQCVPFTSGRISEDYLQKVIRAGFGAVVSRAAVTASAVALARKENITMLGFVRKQSANLYHEGRVRLM